MRAMAAEQDGKVISLFGLIYSDGVNVAFMDLAPGVDIKAIRREFIRGWPLFKEMIESSRVPVVAIFDEGSKETFLQHFGFHAIKDNIYLYGDQ